MTEVLQRIDSLCWKPLKCAPTAKNWSNEDLIHLVKRVLKTDMDLDFLLELRPRDIEILVACIRARIDSLQKS